MPRTTSTPPPQPGPGARADSTPPARPGRGRPRAYDRDQALTAAMLTFWERGYDGASLDALTGATGLHRPSLYAAFGNKEDLYAAAIDHYVATVGQSYFEPLLARKTLAAALDGFYDAVIDAVTGRHGPRGCVVACTLPARAEVSEAARAQLGASLSRLDAAMRERLEAARAAGELAPDADLDALAAVVTSGMLALSIRARGGASRQELTSLARTFTRLVAGA